MDIFESGRRSENDHDITPKKVDIIGRVEGGGSFRLEESLDHVVCDPDETCDRISICFCAPAKRAEMND